MPAELIETTIHERDGITYSISVFHAEGGYWGKCYCPKCEISDGGTNECSTPEEAKRLAKNNADSHHQAAHGPDQSANS